MNDELGSEVPLTIAYLVSGFGADAFDAARRLVIEGADDSLASTIAHETANRLWWAGDESLGERLIVAAELYRRIPSYAALMYWRYSDFDEPTKAAMWEFYREFLAQPIDAMAGPAEYSLWVDYFEDGDTVTRAWHEVAGPQEPRRPRLERVLRASGPVPWSMKSPLYEQLASEEGWDEPLVSALYGSSVDIYGSLEPGPALRILRRLRAPKADGIHAVLDRALSDPRLPLTVGTRREFIADLAKQLGLDLSGRSS